MKRDKHINIRACDDIKNYLQELGGDTAGIYKMFEDRVKLETAMRDLDGMTLDELLTLVKYALINKKSA